MRKEQENIDTLEQIYLCDELEINKEQVELANANLLGFFGVLVRVDKRLNPQDYDW